MFNTFLKVVRLIIVERIGGRLMCLLLIGVLLFAGCSENEYPAPIIVSPEDGATFYPNDLLTFKWEVPDSSRTVEMQTVASLNSDILTAKDHPFDTIKKNYQSSFYSNQSRYAVYVDANITTPIYFGFRLRYHGSHGVSPWSAARYYTLAPLSSLKFKDVVVPFTFDFEARSDGGYYDGEVVSKESINIGELLTSNDLANKALQFIKIDSGYVKDTGGYPSHIDRIAFGFGSQGDITYPFDVLGGASGLIYEPRAEFYPFGGVFRDIYRELSGPPQQMRLVYFLSTFEDKEETIGKHHHIEVYIRLRCYYKQ